MAIFDKGNGWVVDWLVGNRGTLRWRHNGRNGVSNYQPHHCLRNRLFRPRSKKTSKFRDTGVCMGNSPVTGEFPAQRASNAENASIWWRHHESNCSQYWTMNCRPQRDKSNGLAFMWIKNSVYWIYFAKNTYNQVYAWCRKYTKKDTAKDAPVNNYELLNIQACSFLIFRNRGCTPSLVVSFKYWVVPLISTGVSGYSQVTLFS